MNSAVTTAIHLLMRSIQDYWKGKPAPRGGAELDRCSNVIFKVKQRGIAKIFLCNQGFFTFPDGPPANINSWSQ